MTETNVVFWLEDGVDLTLIGHEMPNPDDYRMAAQMVIDRLQEALHSSSDKEIEALFSVEVE